MRAPRRLRLQDDSGFTLVELMITLILMAAVLAGVYGTFFRSQNQANRMNKIAETRQAARTAVQLIERETRMAGSGWGRTLIQTSAGGTPLTYNTVTPRYGGVAGNDSITLIGAWQANSTLSVAMATPTSTLTVASVAGFVANDLIIITNKNGTSAHMFRVTGFAGSNILHASSSPFNVAGGHSGWPAGGYGVGSRVYKATMSSYYVDSTTYRRPALIRNEFGSATTIIAYDPAGMRVWYLMQDGTWTRQPADLSLVDKIIPVVLTRVRDPRQPTVNDSVWAMVRPRTF